MIPAIMIPALGKRSDVQVLLVRWCWPNRCHSNSPMTVSDYLTVADYIAIGVVALLILWGAARLFR
jgi:hypothetical protein